MTIFSRQIILESLGARTEGFEPWEARVCFSGLDWKIDSSGVAAVVGGQARIRSLLLRVVAGMTVPVQGRVYCLADLDGWRQPRALENSRVAYLPPPGEELFVGTSVEDEMAFPSGGSLPEKKKLDRLEQLFGLGLSVLMKSSPWELSQGQKRLLLLASQSLASPEIWVCDEPLEGLDSLRTAVVRNFLVGESHRGCLVLACASRAGALLEWSGQVLVLSDTGTGTYQGPVNELPESACLNLGWYPALRNLALDNPQKMSVEKLKTALKKAVPPENM